MCFNSHYLALILLPVAGVIWLKNYQPKLLKPTFIAIFSFFSLSFLKFSLISNTKGKTLTLLKPFTQRKLPSTSRLTNPSPYSPAFNQINTSLLAAHQSQLVSTFPYSSLLVLLLLFLRINSKTNTLFTSFYGIFLP